jgi:hypothetical protein
MGNGGRFRFRVGRWGSIGLTGGREWYIVGDLNPIVEMVIGA